MKHPLLTLLLLTLFCVSFKADQNCGDGNTYANIKQTQYDQRFDQYERIKGVPKFSKGPKGLRKFIMEKLKLSEEAKGSIFMANFQLTIGCDGSIKAITPMGDPKSHSWTNIEEILRSTEGMWTPAKKDGNPVDCVYFDKFMIMGSQYPGL